MQHQKNGYLAGEHLRLVPLRRHPSQGSPLQRVRCAGCLLCWVGEAETPVHLTSVKQRCFSNPLEVYKVALQTVLQRGCLQLCNMVCMFLLQLDVMQAATSPQNPET